MNKFYQSLYRLLFSYDWDVVEVEGALFKLSWGLWMLLPFPVFRTVSMYSLIAPENVWGIFLILFGTIHLYAVGTQNLHWRRVMSLVSFFFWLFSVILLFLQAPTAALIPTFAIIAFFMGVNFIRLNLLAKIIQ